MYLLDTNLILDACFVGGSWSGQAVRYMIDAGIRRTTTQMVVDEARRRLVVYLTALRNPRAHFHAMDEFIIRCGVEVVPDSVGDAPARIPVNDRFLWPTCMDWNMTLATRDLPLLEAFRECGADALCPLEMISEGQPASRYAFSGVKPSPQAGTLYFHGLDQYWATGVDARVCLFHWGNDLVLDFVPAAQRWVLSGDAFDGVVELQCRAPPEGEDKKIAVTWSARGLYLYDSAEMHPRHNPVIREVRLHGNQCTLGLRADRAHGFTGTVQSLVFDDRNISVQFWNSIKDKGHAFTPQPFDNDRLRLALRR